MSNKKERLFSFAVITSDGYSQTKSMATLEGVIGQMGYSLYAYVQHVFPSAESDDYDTWLGNLHMKTIQNGGQHKFTVGRTEVLVSICECY